MSPIFLRNIALATLCTALVVGGWYAYMRTRYEPPRDAAEELLATNPDFKQAADLFAQGNIDGAIELYGALLDDTKKTDERAIIELRLAIAEFKKDRQAGVQLLKKVGLTSSYPAITRAYAFQYMFWVQRGSGDRELLSLILSGEPFEKLVQGLTTERERLLAANQYVSALYPLGITEMYIAVDLLRNIAAGYDDPYPLTEEAKRKYSAEIARVKLAIKNNDTYMEAIKQGSASYLYPDALMSKANVLGRMERMGLLDEELGTPETFYKEALSPEVLAYVHNDPDIETYYLYYYASYLRRLPNRAIDVRTTLERMVRLAKTSEDFKALVRNNTPTKAGEHANLVALAAHSSSLKQFLNQFGWNLK